MPPTNDEFKLQLPTVNAVATYLLRMGWREVESRSDRVRLFTGFNDAENEPLDLVLPSSDRFSDSHKRILDAIESVANFTDKEISDILSEISTPLVDILKLRLIPGRDLERQDFISVQEAVVITERLRDALAYAAQSENQTVDERTEFVPKINKVGRRFVETCRFGQTFKGSFGFTVESPLLVSQIPLPFPGLGSDIMDKIAPTPFHRRVLQRLSKGFSAAEAAGVNENADLITNSYVTGFNANVCESVAGLFENTLISQIECRFLWSTGWLGTEPTETIMASTSHITRKSAAFLKVAAHTLRKQPTATYKTLVGEIIKMDQAKPSDEVPVNKRGLGHRVVIDTKIDGKITRVFMFLPDVYHRIACDAYRDHKRIQVSGTLEKLPKAWDLKVPHEFSLANDADL